MKLLSTYFISDGERVKIGESTEPKAYLKSLQRAFPAPLRLVLLITGDFAADYRRLFLPVLLKDNWYQLTPELRQFLLDQQPTSPCQDLHRLERLLSYEQRRRGLAARSAFKSLADELKTPAE